MSSSSSSSSCLHHIFVYGTLRAAAPNPMAGFLKTAADLVSAGAVTGKMYLVEKSRSFVYPALTFPPSGSSEEQYQIIGDVFKVKDEVLSDETKLAQVWHRLDDYEGSEYQKVIKRVTLLTTSSEKEQTVDCYLYQYVASVDGLQVITNGDFLRREVLEEKK